MFRGNNFAHLQEHSTVHYSLWYVVPNTLPVGDLVTAKFDLSINRYCCIQLAFFFTNAVCMLLTGTRFCLKYKSFCASVVIIINRKLEGN